MAGVSITKAAPGAAQPDPGLRVAASKIEPAAGSISLARRHVSLRRVSLPRKPNTPELRNRPLVIWGFPSDSRYIL